MEAGDLCWTPDAAFVRETNIHNYMAWLKAERGLDFPDYRSLHEWTVTDIQGFWSSIWQYFEVISPTPYSQVLDRASMPGAVWFDGSRVNYAEHMLRHADALLDSTAVFHASESRPLSELSWRDLRTQVRSLASRLRRMGIKPGDRVAAYMPNIAETLVAMLASAAVGAIWSAAAPEFGSRTVLDRFKQIDPVLLFAVDGYRFGSKAFDRSAEIARIAGELPRLEHVIWLGYLEPDEIAGPIPGAISWQEALSEPDPGADFLFERVSHDHPLWILFTSGTTGMPKAIAHSHVGILLELLKYQSFHCDLHPGDRTFFYATTGWMVWNTIVSALLLGASPILYDGHPTHPADRLWRLCEETKATAFGASPTFVQQMQKAGVEPGRTCDLGALRTIILSGSPATPETFDWFYRSVKSQLWVTSQSGGTEFCSGLVGGVPILPVFASEIQAPLLGVRVEAWDDGGKPVVGEPGELVVLNPMPSMPLRIWNDETGARYRDSYFDMFPGVWRHGDFITFNERGGSYISGRSDATLNRFGVRIGAAEIYNILAEIPEIVDSLVICADMPGGRFFMPLFVKLAPGAEPGDDLAQAIRAALKTKGSPRHVPDEIVPVPDLPYTLSGKKMEVPLRRLLMGGAARDVMSPDSMGNPGIVAWYEAYAAAFARRAFTA